MARLRKDELPARLKLVSGCYYYAPGALGKRARELRSTIPLGKNQQRAVTMAAEIEACLKTGTPWSPSVEVTDGKLRVLLYRSRERAKALKLQHDLTFAFLQEMFATQRGACAVSGIKFDTAKRGRWAGPWAPSIDRIDSRRGYTVDNVRLVCHAVNVALNEWGDGVLQTIADAISEKRRNSEK